MLVLYKINTYGLKFPIGYHHSLETAIIQAKCVASSDLIPNTIMECHDSYGNDLVYLNTLNAINETLEQLNFLNINNDIFIFNHWYKIGTVHSVN